MPRLIFPVLLILIISCGEDSSAEKSHARQKKREKSALTLMRQDDCFNCHSIVDKTIGPAYIEIARKYDHDEATVTRLADKIIEGGGGLWGGALMSKHPFLKKPDALKIVRWVLSLDTPQAEEGIPAHGLLLKELAGQNLKEGLSVTGYTWASEQPFPQKGFPSTDGVTPTVEATVSALDFRDNQAFEPLGEHFYLKASGKINIERRGKYFFRLDKKGRAAVKLDGRLIISEAADDYEIGLDLEKGEYELLIEYLSAPGENRLSLFWIPLQEEYYQLLQGSVWH